MKENRRKLMVGVFLDGRPGHEKQTLGILNYLEELFVLETRIFNVKKVSILRQLLRIFNLFFSLPSMTYDGISECDFLIGTGTHTHLPMLLSKKHYDIPVMTCMTPMSFLIKFFDLIFSPLHDNAPSRKNIFVTVGPPNNCINIEAHDPERILILVGGTDSKSHHWDSKEIVSDIQKIIHSRPSGKIVISSSPRTPEETVNLLISMSETFTNVEFFHFSDTPRGWVERHYNNSKEVWVTGDSMSMVYEALSSGCKVGLIPVKWKKMSSKFTVSEKYLKENGLVISLESYLKGHDIGNNGKELNEARRCAEEIVRWLR